MSTKDWTKRIKLLGEKLKKLRYPALILVIGIALMLIPSRKQSSEKKEQSVVTLAPSEPDYRQQVEAQLQQTLSKVDGVGRVSVMLTLRTGTETIYQTDSTLCSQSGDNASSDASESTVLISKSNSGQEAVVRKTIFPGFLGALIVCDGADDPEVKLNVINAVSGITGMSSERITVVKMK